jgi:four helix bundle protein
MQDFRKLIAWQKSHRLVLRTYAVSATFPKTEMFGLTAQMRRAAVSIPANIAEGSCRSGRAFAQFLKVSLGSAGELEYYAILAGDLKLISLSTSEELQSKVIEAKKIISGLFESVKEANRKAVIRTRKNGKNGHAKKLTTDN